MKNTTKVTIYHLNNNAYERIVIDGCFWDEDQAQSIKKSGLASVDSLYVSIPYSSTDSLEITKGDYIVLGENSLEFDNTSDKTKSDSLKLLKASCNVFTINSMSFKNHGSKRMWHYELSGK